MSGTQTAGAGGAARQPEASGRPRGAPTTGAGPSAEPLPEPSGAGTVLLDVGGGVGAAVVLVPAELEGVELEIRTEPGSWNGRHVAVRPRPIGGGVVYAAVFPDLPAGSYRIRERGGPGAPVVGVEVAGGAVTEAAWSP